MRTAEDYQRAERLRPGDPCEFRYPARSEWLLGVVVRNGGYGYWHVLDLTDREGRRGQVARGGYIEHVRAPTWPFEWLPAYGWLPAHDDPHPQAIEALADELLDGILGARR
jgi:hypothetical protein